MIDLHAHLLFGVDDGPQTLGEAVALAEAAVAAGTTVLVATPHVDSTFGLDAADRVAPHAAVVEALAREGIALEVPLGAEIALDRLLDLEDSERDALALGDGPYLLLEAPLAPAAGAFDRYLHDLLAHGTQMLIAHPERCPAFQRRPQLLHELVAAGALCQVTAASFDGAFGEAVRRFAMQLAAGGMIHVIASDAHDSRRREPALRGAIERADAELPGIAALADWWTLEVPRAILDGAPLPSRPPLPVPPPRRRTLLDRALGRSD